MRDRLVELDGLRALAIVLVIGNHYAHFWTPTGRGLSLLPYGDALQWMPFQSFSGLGVSLFFVISGFMITLALHRSETALDFATLRAIRLWPTLLLCGGLTFLATSLLGPAELQRSPAEAAVSLSFLPPEHVGRMLGLADWEWLDGAYWSLFVQVRFFAVAAVLHYGLGGRLLSGWILFSVVGFVLHAAYLGGNDAADWLAGLAFAEFHPFFSAGIGLALIKSGRGARAGVALFAVGVIQAVLYARAAEGDVARLLSVAAIFALVGLGVLLPRAIALFGWAPLVALGQGSYIVYLLHQNFGLALLTALPDMGRLPSILAMLAIQAGIALFAIWAFRNVERPLGRWLRGLALRRGTERPLRAV